MSAHRQRVRAEHFLLLAHDEDGWVLLLVSCFGDHDFTETSLLVKLLTVGHAFFDALKGHCAFFLRDDDVVVRIPLAHRRVLLDLLAVLDKQHRTVWQHCGAQRHVGRGVHDLEFRRTRHHDHFLFAFGVGAVHRAQFVDFHDAFVLGADLVLVRDLGCRTTHVERTKRQLRARFSNGLCCNHTHSLPCLHRAVGGEVLAVALGADTLA